MHPLDRPIWSALTSVHAGHARGDARARRYPAEIVPFAATRDDEAESLAALLPLVPAGDGVRMLQAEPIALPPGLVSRSSLEGVQLVAKAAFPRVIDARIAALSQSDAAEMLALVTLTRPGPFTLRALELGGFWGIRIEGRLVAMAGERMRLAGHGEVSGVCAHPEHRGKGLARLLSLVVAGEISARGDRPFLHAYRDNVAAIALYESLGFERRSGVHVAAVERAD